MSILDAMAFATYHHNGQTSRYFESQGILKTEDANGRNLMVECDAGLGDYYRRLVQLFIGQACKVGKPMWGYHITIWLGKYDVVSDDLVDLWKQQDGLPIDYWYSNDIQSDGLYFWLPVKSEPIHALREQFGFPRELKFPLHLTIGNLK